MVNRGCRVASRLANLYPGRFTAFAFLAVGYVPPNPVPNWEQTNEMIKGLLKREIFGYQAWFSEDGTEEVLETKVNPSTVPRVRRINIHCSVLCW